MIQHLPRTEAQTVAAAWAASQCQNTMARFTNIREAGMTAGQFQALWADRDDSSVEMTWGTYTGYDGIKRCFDGGFHAFFAGDNIGDMAIHSMNTPVIEVAGDGKTARGVFFSPGVETSTDPETGKARCNWCWIKYGVDFICEDGRWYIWHFSTFGTFMCDFYKSWGDEEIRPGCLREDNWIETHVPKDYWPDAPITHNDWVYRTDVAPELNPVPPLPYGTFEEVGYNICCPTATTKKE